MNFDIKVKKLLKEYMNIRPDQPRRRNGDSPMGATVHHYGAPKDTKEQPATTDTRYDTTLIHDIAPETLTLLSIRQDETGPAPADPNDLGSLKYFRQQPPKMRQQIVDDLHTLAGRVPSDELKQSLTNLASVLGSWPLS